MKKKLLLGLGASILSVSVLAGCGDVDNNDNLDPIDENNSPPVNENNNNDVPGNEPGNDLNEDNDLNEENDLNEDNDNNM